MYLKNKDQVLFVIRPNDKLSQPVELLYWFLLTVNNVAWSSGLNEQLRSTSEIQRVMVVGGTVKSTYVAGGHNSN